MLSIVFYVGARAKAHQLDSLDWARVWIPPLAFFAWTMLQPATAFDAFWPSLSAPTRFVCALFIAALLGPAAAWLGYKADQSDPTKQNKAAKVGTAAVQGHS